jgi:hypothetical protein
MENRIELATLRTLGAKRRQFRDVLGKQLYGSRGAYLRLTAYE